MSLRRVAVVSAFALGCASSPALRRAPRYCPEPVDAPVVAAPEVNRAPPAPPPVPTSRPQRVETLAGSTAASSEDQRGDLDEEEREPPCVPRPRGTRDAIAGLEAQIAQGMAAFAAPEPGCRDICRASEGVCAASREICRLTGDGDDDHPIDLRCARAREACADASRQRDGRCPVCPSS